MSAYAPTIRAQAWKEHIERNCTGLRFRLSVPGKELTTFGLGGDVALLVEAATSEGLISLLPLLQKHGIPWRIMGAGSNLVIPDRGVEEVVLRLGKELSGYLCGDKITTEIEGITEQCLRAQGKEGAGIDGAGDCLNILVFAGASLMGLSRKLSAAGYSGLEFAAGIPASMGGAVRMNAGAHGHSISEVVKAVLVADADGGMRRLSVSELDFGYRHSSILANTIVLAAELELHRKDPEVIWRERSKCLEYRRNTQPLHLPSAGSAFRNPSPPSKSAGKMPMDDLPAAAKLLEQAGLKGLRCGGVCFSELHANWLVKIGDEARADDVHFLLETAREKIRDTYAHDLKPEIILW